MKVLLILGRKGETIGITAQTSTQIGVSTLSIHPFAKSDDLSQIVVGLDLVHKIARDIFVVGGGAEVAWVGVEPPRLRYPPNRAPRRFLHLSRKAYCSLSDSARSRCP